MKHAIKRFEAFQLFDNGPPTKSTKAGKSWISFKRQNDDGDKANSEKTWEMVKKILVETETPLSMYLATSSS